MFQISTNLNLTQDTIAFLKDLSSDISIPIATFLAPVIGGALTAIFMKSSERKRMEIEHKHWQGAFSLKERLAGLNDIHKNVVFCITLYRQLLCLLEGTEVESQEVIDKINKTLIKLRKHNKKIRNKIQQVSIFFPNEDLDAIEDLSNLIARGVVILQSISVGRTQYSYKNFFMNELSPQYDIVRDVISKNMHVTQ